MTVDDDGYGAREGQSPLDRLIEDCRTLSPAGIERVADGWVRHAEAPHHQTFLDAERAALRVLETERRGEEWDGVRTRLLGLTERGTPMIAWRAEHGEVGHRAERALLGAALALLAGSGLDGPHRRALLAPMAGALPWLLPGGAPVSS